MPTLPTITITDQAVWDRLMAVFVDPLTYRNWLKQQLIAEVKRAEFIAAQNQVKADLEAGIPTN